LLRPLGPRGSHVNLIPLNDTDGYAGTAPVAVRMQAFATVLRSGGLTATVRRNRGTAIDAACGQLRSRSEGLLADPAVRNSTDRSARMAP
jgi:23S rRNA (adenine2503-C2)-methyltransferase